jgi:hypothetical protein
MRLFHNDHRSETAKGVTAVRFIARFASEAAFVRLARNDERGRIFH